jgi:hypothetical protein
MDLTLIITILGTGIAVIASNIGIMAWLRSDIKSFETEIRGWKNEINKEMKDFHGRLCSLESRYHEKNRTDP